MREAPRQNILLKNRLVPHLREDTHIATHNTQHAQHSHTHTHRSYHNRRHHHRRRRASSRILLLEFPAAHVETEFPAAHVETDTITDVPTEDYMGRA